MIKLPAKLEERLKNLFSRAGDRNQFVKKAVETALDEIEKTGKVKHGVVAVGGDISLYCDGGSRGNPGNAAIGFVIKDPGSGKILKEHGKLIGIATNNEAEYKSLIAGLEETTKFQPNHLTCYLDSELVVKQVSGEYKVKMRTLQPLVEEVIALASRFRDVRFVHISRSENKEADRLVNNALDDRRQI